MVGFNSGEMNGSPAAKPLPDSLFFLNGTRKQYNMIYFSS